jgi:protein SCO1
MGKVIVYYLVIIGFTLTSTLTSTLYSGDGCCNSAQLDRKNVNHIGYTSTIGKKKVRNIAKYKVPDVTLTNQDGVKVDLKELMNSDKIVALEFIFTTCTTICPVLSAGFSNLQENLGPDAENVQMVSITIDPEYDTPNVLKEYSQRYKAEKGWDFLTGSRKDIDSVMKAFDAFVSNKMSHLPLTFLHYPGKTEWVRVLGLLSASELEKESYAMLNK